VVSTQRAIKSYISAQIGGGGASLNVNSIIAGFVQINGSQITTTTGGTIQMKATLNFQSGIKGYRISGNTVNRIPATVRLRKARLLKRSWKTTRKAKLRRTLFKRKMSMQRRKSMGLK
jgi:hypothetical protein